MFYNIKMIINDKEFIISFYSLVKKYYLCAHN